MVHGTNGSIEVGYKKYYAVALLIQRVPIGCFLMGDGAFGQCDPYSGCMISCVYSPGNERSDQQYFKEGMP